MRRGVNPMGGVADLMEATAGITSFDLGSGSSSCATTTKNEATDNNINAKNGN